jgi:hypothetical protein
LEAIHTRNQVCRRKHFFEVYTPFESGVVAFAFDIDINSANDNGVLQRGSSIVALEIKNGAPRHAHSGLAAFRKEFALRSAMLVGEGGMPLKEFFTSDPKDWL